MLLGICLPLIAQAQQIPAAPANWVTDRVGLLSSSKAEQLNERLEAFQEKTGHQIVVYVDKSTGGEDIDTWAAKTFEKWKVGRKGIDDGLAVFIFTGDRTARIEVGYGLEGTIPDAVASQILRDTILPGLAKGEADAAVSDGVDQLLTRIDSGAAGTPGIELPQLGPLQIFGIVLVLILIGYLAIRHPAIAYFILVNVLSSRRNSDGWGGSSGGGGGFSGGGGRSGGGGASGRW